LVLEKLNASHYMARWEAGAEGPRVILGMCPYAALIEKHPELCRMDTAMLSAYLGQDVKQRTKLSPVCVFVMK
jgi:predicted ArsR family transcriptional regulator